MKSEAERAERLLAVYQSLKNGEIVNAKEESKTYGVSTRTIQRDIENIQCFLQNQTNENGEIKTIVFDRKKGGYRIETTVKDRLDAKEILTICKILLESRALMKDELFPIIHRLLGLCGSEQENKMIHDLIRNEMYHYIELRHGQRLVDWIWKLEEAVKYQKYINITYHKIKNDEVVVRKVKPVGVMFSEFYFYMTAYIEQIDKEENFRNPDDTFPTIYRVDRLQEIKVLDEHFSIPYKERFEEGEFRKRIQFMYGGKLRKLKFKYKGSSLNNILDRLPTAEIVQEEEDGVVIQAEVFGDGVDMWIRSQGALIELIQLQ